MASLRRVKAFATMLFLPSVVVLLYRRGAPLDRHDQVQSEHNYTEVREVLTTTIPYDPDEVMKRFASRRARMKEVCERRKHEPLRTRWRKRAIFLVDSPSRLLVCAVPKSGSSSWHSVIWAINRLRNGLDQDHSHYTPEDTKRNQGMPGKLTVNEGNKLIRPIEGDDDFWKSPPPNSSFRLILARHPFARFISGWNQKFMVSSNYWPFLFKSYPMLLRYKKDSIEKYVISFNDFATFIVDVYGGGRYFDLHFHPATTLCRPCEYDYTYILKAESVNLDEQWLMERINHTDIISPRSGVARGGSVVNDDAKKSIKKYMSMLKPDVVKKLYKLYEADFDYFGYTFNFTTLEAGGFD